jgi:hypothetical protein
MMPGSGVSNRRRERVAIAVAVAAGVVIALVDSSPGWDDTGVTVGLLVLAAAAAAALSGRRPWLFALLVGVWTPAVEIARGGQLASLAALAFSLGGAIAGYLVARLVPPRPTAPPDTR